MNVAIMKTKAEQGLSEAFESTAETLPGNAAVKSLRAQAIGQFGAMGLPHRRIEEWKYTDLRVLIKDAAPGTESRDPASVTAAYKDVLAPVEADTYIFVDGRLASAPKSGAVSGVSVESLATSLANGPAALNYDAPLTLDAGAKSVVALNTAFASDGALVHIDASAKPERPLHLVFISTGTVAVRNQITAGTGSEATVIETHVSRAGSKGGTVRHENAVTMIALGDAATLHHVTIAEAASGEVHLGNTLAHLGANASYNPFQLTSGQGLVRHQMTVIFAGQHASFDLRRRSAFNATGHVDTTLVVDHAVPHCTSRELYKCVLDGRARGIFQGKVIVRPDAQKTDGKQMAQALMLSADAEFDSKPELEIYADDVVCGHGTTTMQLDEDLMFYCMSRGIPEKEARALLIESFIGEAFDKIGHEGLRLALSQYATDWLNAARS